MKYRILGRTGVKVSPLALGTDNFSNPTSEKDSIQIIDQALSGGINLIDTSNSYAKGEAERIIGKALKENRLRDQTLIATKAHYPTGTGPNDNGNSRLHLMQACEASLKRLQIDTIDLFQLHRPSFDIPYVWAWFAMLVFQLHQLGKSWKPSW